MSSDKENIYLNIGTGVSSAESRKEATSASDSNFNDAIFAGFGPTTHPTRNKDATPKEEKKDTPRLKDEQWHDTPTYSNQLAKWPEHCNLIGPKFKQFDLSTQEEALDEFMLQTLPEEAPSIWVESTDKQFGATSEGWKILVTYYKVKYRKLLDKGSK